MRCSKRWPRSRPIVSRLPGSTDKIVSPGESGFLCSNGNPQEYVDALVRVRDEKGLQRACSERAPR